MRRIRFTFTKTVVSKAIQYTGKNIRDCIEFGLDVMREKDGKYGIGRRKFHELKVDDWLVKEDDNPTYIMSDREFLEEFSKNEWHQQ